MVLGVSETSRSAWNFFSDKLLLAVIALALVAPIAWFVYSQSDPPLVCESGADIDKQPSDTELLVTNNLTDADLEALGRLDALAELQLMNGAFTDAGLDAVAAKTGLTSLVMHGRRVTDAGTAKLAALRNLESLQLIECVEVTPRGLRFLTDLPRLESLVLHQCRSVDDDIAATLPDCKALAGLSITLSNHITDRTAEAISRIGSLRRLQLDFCPKVGNAGIAAIASLPLEVLSLHGLDTLTDEALEHLAQMKTLRKLELPLKAEFSNAAVERLRAALPDCEVLS